MSWKRRRRKAKEVALDVVGELPNAAADAAMQTPAGLVVLGGIAAAVGLGLGVRWLWRRRKR